MILDPKLLASPMTYESYLEYWNDIVSEKSPETARYKEQNLYKYAHAALEITQKVEKTLTLEKKLFNEIIKWCKTAPFSLNLSMIAEPWCGDISHILPVLYAIQVASEEKISVSIYLRDSNETFSTVYIDPSRRVESKKVFLLKDCEPDVISNLKLLSEHSDRIIIKTAPLLDIQSAIRELQKISEIHVISIKNECKELLIVIDKDNANEDPLITCVSIGNQENKYNFKLSEEKNYNITNYSEPLEYIYEPDTALLKAGCFKLICRDFKIEKLHQHTHLYTSKELINEFPGRKFKIKKLWIYGQFSKENEIKKANIICRNFGLSPEEIKKKLKIKDGGDDYLLFCTGLNNELLVINCERII
jgi:hypothetical protein